MGILLVVLDLLLPHVTPCPSGLRIKSAMTVRDAGVTVRGSDVHVPVGPKRSVLTFWGGIPSSTACVAMFSTKSLGPHM